MVDFTTKYMVSKRKLKLDFIFHLQKYFIFREI
eukprot:UN28112